MSNKVSYGKKIDLAKFQSENKCYARELIALPQPNECLMLLAPLWVAVGALATWHKIVSDVRNVMPLLPPDPNDVMQLQGLAVRVSMLHLNEQEQRTFVMLADASLRASGFYVSDIPSNCESKGELPGVLRIEWAGGVPGAALVVGRRLA